MPALCEVALPVPLDRTFTYAVHANPTLRACDGAALAVSGRVPVVGGRVIVPFGGQKLTGVVTRLHDDPIPEGIAIKPIEHVLDPTPLLTEELLRLAEWMAQYYVAPLGEVLRGMLPLSAEVRTDSVYRITDTGRKILFESADRGASRRSRKSPEQQDREYAILNRLEDGDPVREVTLRSSVKATPRLLTGMVRKRWIEREVVAAPRDARMTEQIAVLVDDARLPKLNANQTTILTELASAGGRMPVRELRRLPIPQSTLATLVRRNLIRLEELPAKFSVSSVSPNASRASHLHRLNEAQTAALASIAIVLEKPAQDKFQPMLLHGVTGSGKTAVYIAAMQRALALNKSALLLVPEIGLTPQMGGEMHAAFGTSVALLHSGLRPDERAGQWHRIRNGEARIVVGTRSAIFAPLVSLGLIIVDEEHDSSYKQEETPRYNGRDVAVIRARLNHAVIVLGSATPSLESWSNAARGRYALIEIKDRVADRPLPQVELLDMRKEFQETGREELFSRRLIEETRSALDRGEQVIILLNRRGYSFVVLCRSCGEKLQCENCAIALTHHKPPHGEDAHATIGQRLECHYCGYRRTVPKLCPKCNSEHLYYLGAGSQQGEERLQQIFPTARIGRMDRDTIRGRAGMERLLGRLHSGEINLLVGTQMIAKGHDIHGVTLVGVVGADNALSLPDFRASERVFQLLTQVAGRAGRGELAGRVVVQTYYPEHYAIRHAAAHDYTGFATRELQFRRWMHYPPETSLANVIIHSEKLEEAVHWVGVVGRLLQATKEGLRVLGPAPAPIMRLKRSYRYHLVIKSSSRQLLGMTLRKMLTAAEAHGIPQRNIIVDIDAVHLM